MTRRFFLTQTLNVGVGLALDPCVNFMAGETVGPSPGYFSLGEMLSSIRDSFGLPALAAGVMKNGKAIASGAVGFRKAGSFEKVTMLDKFHLVHFRLLPVRFHKCDANS